MLFNFGSRRSPAILIHLAHTYVRNYNDTTTMNNMSLVAKTDMISHVTLCMCHLSNTMCIVYYQSRYMVNDVYLDKLYHTCIDMATSTLR